MHKAYLEDALARVNYFLVTHIQLKKKKKRKSHSYLFVE